MVHDFSRCSDLSVDHYTIMKIFVAHSSNFDFQNELYAPLRNSELNKKHEIILPQEGGQKESATKEIIQSCDVVVVEVSYPSTGSGIELGWADVFEKPIICIYKKGTKPSTALEKLKPTFISYKDSEDMIAKLQQSIGG